MRTSLHLVVYCWLICVLSWRTVADNKSQPISIFRSRPDLKAPILTVLTSVPEKVAPGYYFVAPYQQAQETIHIYDNEANLIYSGFGSAGPGIIHAPQTCMYQGEVHLCFYQGTQMVGWGHGHGVIMDKHYRVVKSVEPASYQASSDMHEFRLIDDGRSALMTQYLRSVYDLCPWNLCDGLGYIQQGVFQEIDTETGELLFEWQSLDHVDPNESYVGPGTTEVSGSGQQPDSPWDYFHINSIDKNEQGDYLISARHVSAVYKISGVDGHVIWRLNGALSDYDLDGFSFSFQHDARFLSDNETHTVISLFDNGSNGFNQTQPYSTGQIISLDHRTKIATCLLKLDPPPVVEGKVGGGHISKSQGNMQQLPNGNFLLGWGNDAFWTEYAATDDHEVVFYGTLGWTNLMNYRVHKFDNWVGRPLTKPALWTYSKHGNNVTTEKMTLYVSWNGATEVKAWRFFGSDDNKMDHDSKQGRIWAMLGTDPVPKSGFETVYFFPKMYRFAYAEALDKDGNVLGTSAVAKTFMPNHQMQEHCDDLACRFMPTEEEREKYAAQQQEKEAQEKLNRQERTRLRARVKKSVELYAGTFGLLAFLTVLLVVLVTRNFVSRPLYFVVHRVGSLANRIIDRRNDGIGFRGSSSLPRYKALSLDDHEGDHEHGND